MNRMTAYVLLCVFSLVFLAGFLYSNRLAQALSIAGQVGMAISLVLFFVLPAAPKPPKKKL